MMSFRKAHYSDTRALTRLIISAYRGETSKVGWTTEEHILGGVRIRPGELRKRIGGQHLLIAEENGEIVGCVYLELRKESVYLGMLTVKPTLQTKGVGKALLLEAEKFAKENGKKKIVMTVIDTRSELIAFYERRGYRASGRYEPFPMNDPNFGIPKVDVIRLKVFEKEVV